MDPQAVGLPVGAEVRFRRRPNERWHAGVVEQVERDGSIGLRDEKGASRAIPLGRIEVKQRGPRGGVHWVPAPEVADRTEQLDLF